MWLHLLYFIFCIVQGEAKQVQSSNCKMWWSFSVLINNSHQPAVFKPRGLIVKHFKV